MLNLCNMILMDEIIVMLIEKFQQLDELDCLYSGALISIIGWFMRVSVTL